MKRWKARRAWFARFAAALGRQVGQTALTLLGASVIIWSTLLLLPGDPVLQLLQTRGNTDPSPADITAARAELGLDEPVPMRYLQWLGRVVQGDLGESWSTGLPIVEELTPRLGSTALLAAIAVTLGLALAVVTGLIAARYAGRWPDELIRAALMTGALPGFLIALIILQTMVWTGIGSTITDGRLGTVLPPALPLALAIAPRWSRLLRAGLLDAMRSPYVMVATSRGSTQARNLVRHALPNAFLPILNLVGLTMGWLLGGVVVVEAVFTWPGLGQYALTAVFNRDLPVIQAYALIATLAYVLTSRIVDAVVRTIDPRAAQEVR